MVLYLLYRRSLHLSLAIDFSIYCSLVVRLLILTLNTKLKGSMAMDMTMSFV